MTFEEMEQAFFDHEAFELVYDLAGTMTTLVDVPKYELPALGLRIEGKEAATELYRRMLVVAERTAQWAEKRAGHGSMPNHLVREAYIWYNTDDGGRARGTYCVVISFEDGKISGERLYFDNEYAALMGAGLGEDFIDFPGVSRLTEDI